MSEYIEFINELLACESGKKAIVYQKYSRLVDDKLPEVMEMYAAKVLDPYSKMYSDYRHVLLMEARTLAKNIDNCNRLNAQGVELFNQGKITAAIAILQRAVELASYNFPSSNQYLAGTLNNLARLYEVQGQLAEAELLYKRALTIYGELFGDSLRDGKAERPSEAVTDTLGNLARLYESQGRSAEARLLYPQVQVIYEELSGDEAKRVDEQQIPEYIEFINELLACTAETENAVYQKYSRLIDETLPTVMEFYATATFDPSSLMYLNQHFYRSTLLTQAQILTKNISDWNQLNAQANELHRQGKFVAVMAILQQALDLARDNFPVPNKFLANSLDNLARLYVSQGQWAEAEPLYDRALAMYGKLFGNQLNDNVLATLYNLTKLYELQGRTAEAASLRKRALQDPAEIISISSDWNQLNSQAVELHRQGEIAAAIPIAQQALDLIQKSFPIPNNPLEAFSLNNLGGLYKSQGRWTEAEPLLERALAIRQELFRDRPNDDLAMSLNSLAELYRSQGRWAEAEPLYNRALAIYTELFGNALRDGKAEQPNGDFAACLNNLAELHVLQGRWAVAEPLHERAQAMYEELCGDPLRDGKAKRLHNDLASSLNNLGGLYEFQGRWAEAEPLYNRALAIRQALFGDRPNHDLATSLSNLGLFYKLQGRWDEAESHLYRALTILEELFGDRPNDLLATSLNNLALIYTRQWRWAEAEAMYDRALAILEKLLGDRPHKSLATTLINLAGLYTDQGRWTEAEPLYNRALAIWQELLGDVGHPDLVANLTNLAIFHARQQQPDKSLLLFQQAIELENRWLTTVIAATDRQQRLKDLEKRHEHIECLLSLTQQYFPTDPVAVTAALNAVLSRKAQATATEAAVNQAIQQQPELAPDLQQLKTYQQEIAALSYTIAERPELKDRLNTLLQQRKELERRLGRSIPAIDLAQQVVDRQALTSILPPDAFLIEFIRYRPYDFIHKQWQSARYLAFIVPPNSAEGVMAIDCGIAEDLDLAIDKFRRAYADIDFSGEHSGMGTQTIAELPAPKDDRQFQFDLLDRLLPHLPATGTCYLATDSHLQILPFHLIETTEGEYFGDRYRLHHLTTARDLLRHQRVPTSTNPPLILADPDYDGGIAPTPSIHPKTGLQVSDRLDGQRFDRLLINRQFGERVARSYGATCYTDIAATVGRLERLNAPRLLFIATHGFSLPTHHDLIETIQNCVGGKEEAILRNRASEITPAFRAYWQQSADAGNEWCQRIVRIIDEIGSDLPLPDLLAQPTDDPMLRSGIALAGANIWRFQGQEDPRFGKGVVFADDITQWNLWGNELSVLVTCVSGLGAVSNSEGVFGLRRALAIAGAKYVISSLWNIPTKPSVLLMNKFFEIYQSATKPNPAVALAQAQAYIRNITCGELNSSSIGREIIRELLAVRALSSIATDDVKPLADPYFWGAWICQG